MRFRPPRSAPAALVALWGGAGCGPEPEPAPWGSNATEPFVLPSEACTGKQDEDLDGLVDCEDPDCDGPDCREDCIDGRDNDLSGFEDCQDAACFCTQNCPCDADGDGFLSILHGGLDCDDLSAVVHPEAREECNLYDDDCDGLLDEEDPEVDPTTGVESFRDVDGDGFGDPDAGEFHCVVPLGSVLNDLDCDDTSADVHPGANEICNGLDDDCDDDTDDEDLSVDASTLFTWYVDTDHDGVGVGAYPITDCDPIGLDYALVTGDCAPLDPWIRAGEWQFDADGDGQGAGDPWPVETCTSPGPGWVLAGPDEDCAPDDPLRKAGPGELCGNGLDDDCNGVIDDCACPGMVASRGPANKDFESTVWLDFATQVVDPPCPIEIRDEGEGLNLGELESRGTRVLILDSPGVASLSQLDADIIQVFLKQGHGGLVLLRGITSNTEDNTFLYPLVGLEVTPLKNVSAVVASHAVTAFDHPVMENIPPSFRPFEDPDLGVAVEWARLDGDLYAALLPGSTLLAIAIDGNAPIIAYETDTFRAVWISPALYINASPDGLALLGNALVWAAGYTP